MVVPKKARRLGGSASNQKAILKNLAVSLFENGRVTTTLAKGKYLRGYVDRLITFARKGDLASRRMCLKMVNNADIVKKLFDEIGPASYGRTSGFTRLLRYKNRLGDGAELVIIELIK
ncbi:MAG: 50S ribosomal protein L17 [Actinobacteria bacterium]|nr:50S ribosomal protein L17 [Actinomycetota bacterium]MBM3712723.1 50S ribosomal protein L17 [Actinomycetota bacterium]